MTDPALIFLTAGGLFCIASLVVGLLIHFLPESRVSTAAIPLLRKKRDTLSDYNGFSAFTKDEIGDIERCIPSLQKVIVISSIVEKPSKSLLDAVFDNFQQGVEYTFLVSANGNSDDELLGYRDWFLAIYNSAKGWLLQMAKTPEYLRLISLNFFLFESSTLSGIPSLTFFTFTMKAVKQVSWR